MLTKTKNYARSSLALTIDRGAVLLAAVFIVVMVGGVALAMSTPGPEPSPPPAIENQDGATVGGLWAVAEAAMAGLLLLFIWLLKFVPEWIRDALKRTIALFLVFFVGGAAGASGVFWRAAGLLVGVWFALEIIENTGLWWAFNNLAAVGLAVYMAGIGAKVLGFEAIGVAIVLLSVYDWYFADKEKWMFTLFLPLVRNRLPVLFMVPTRLRFDWDDWIDSLSFENESDTEEAEQHPDEDDEKPLMAMGIGTADLLLPAMFAAAVAITPSPLAFNGIPAPVLGVAGGTALAAFRIRWKMVNRGAGAGMPPIAAGAITGYAVVALPLYLGTLL